MASPTAIGPLLGYAPAASRRPEIVRGAVEGAAWHLGCEADVVTTPAALSARLETEPPGLLVVLDDNDAAHAGLMAGWIVLTSRRHLDARHGREIFWVATERTEVYVRALLHVGRLPPAALDGVRAAAQALGRSTMPEEFRTRWAAPLVSVVMPVFNAAASVEVSIRSVLSQTVADIELVVVDDGSSDASRQCVAAVEDRRVVTVWDRGGGPAHARNRGLAFASTDEDGYVAFLDADDTWDPAFLEQMVESLAAAPPQVALAYCDYAFSMSGSAPTRQVVVDGSFPALALSEGLIPMGSFVLRRSAADAVGPFDQALQRGEDYAWLLKVAAEYDLVRVPQVLFHYERRPDGQLMRTAPDRDALQRSRLAAFDVWARRMDAAPTPSRHSKDP